MTKIERDDALLILKYFGPMNSKILAIWYNHSYGYRRKIIPEEMEQELSVLVKAKEKA